MTRIDTLEGKWVLVTGAASGIGLACAKSCAKRGSNVIATDVNAAALATALQEIESFGTTCRSQVCNVADEGSADACAAAVHREIGALDVLVNNAGIAYFGGFLETPIAEWRRILDVNVMGIVHMVRAFLPAMQAAGGPRRIVNIASAAAYSPVPNMSAYAASKGAVKQFSEVLAMELTGSNVMVQAVYPGIINTPIVSGVTARGSNISDAQFATLQRYYVDKGCRPDVVGEDVARAVLAGTAYIYTGPMSRIGNVASRLSTRLARAGLLAASRRNGYLPAG